MVCDYTYDDESRTIRVNCLGCIYGSSVENFDVCMARTVSKLIERPEAMRVVLAAEREYDYDYNNVKLLKEIASAIKQINDMGIVSTKNVTIPQCTKCAPSRYATLQSIVSAIKYDPIKAYNSTLREIRLARIMEKRAPDICKRCTERYISNALVPVKTILENLSIIKMAGGHVTEISDRSFYRSIFHPVIRPNFMYTRYLSLPPKNAEIVENYKIPEGEVEIYKIKGSTRYLYHLIPPEFKLSEDHYILLDTARRYMMEHKPMETEMVDPEKIRDNLYNIGKDLIRDLAKQRNYHLNEDDINKLTSILTRYTAGLGIIEVLMSDPNVQDISINAPLGESPIFLFHAKYEDCETNIYPSKEDGELWATRFRLQSGRPLDEANPVLDTEVTLPGGSARICAITRTLSPKGLGFAFRRHREKPWTFPLFIRNRYLNPLGAGLLWFIIDGARTILVAGTRSAGKTSLLGSMLVQIMPRYRIITTEDTLELPMEALRKIGYNVQRLKSRSVITKVETELPAEEALRTALRLGDSCLIVGEVRSKEALALYEAMRIGALANVVAGTIHGDSAYGVFDRVVNDLGVPKTSFKATDIVVVANRLKSADGLHSFRRVVEITEVRKHWTDDPVKEGGFINLMQYSAKEDQLKPTDTLLTGESVILNDIAERVREWKGNWDLVWNNIVLRGKILEYIANVPESKKHLLEAPYVVKSNSMFHIISDEVKEELGTLDSDEIFRRWKNWFDDLK